MQLVGRTRRVMPNTLVIGLPGVTLAPEVALALLVVTLLALLWIVATSVLHARRRRQLLEDVERARSAQARAEHEAAHQRQLVRQTFTDAPIATAVLNRDQRFTAVNRAWCRQNGQSPEATIGRPWSQVFPNLASELESVVARVMDSGVLEACEVVLDSGEAAEATVSPVWHPDGGCEGTLLALHPGVVPANGGTTLSAEVVPWSIVPAWLLKVSPTGAINEVTGGLAETVGARRHELLGRQVADLLVVHSGDTARWFEQLVRTGGVARARARLAGSAVATGSERSVAISVAVEPLPEGAELPSVWVAVRDLSEVETLEQHQQLADKRFLAASLVSGHPLVMVGPQSDVVFWSGEAERVFGTTVGEAVGKRLTELVVEEGDELLAGSTGDQTVQGRFRTVDGVVGMEVRCAQLGHGTQRYRMLVFDDRRGPSDRAGAVVESLLEAVRGSLNAVLSHSDLLLEECDGQRHAQSLRRAANEVVQTTVDLAELCRLEEGRLVLEALELDVRAAVARALEPLAMASEREIVSLLHPEVPDRVVGDPGRLRYVVRSLVALAMHLSEGESVSIGVRGGDGDQRPLRFEVVAGGGIAPYRLDGVRRAMARIDSSTIHMFAQELRSLAIARRLIERMGGQLLIETSGGRGTAFWFELRLPVAASVAQDQVRGLSSTVRTKRILVVDDCEASRSVLCTYLNAWGARNGAVADGEQALQLLRQAEDDHDPFDLALVDRDMPGLDGETLGAVISNEPHLRSVRLVLLTSLGRRGDAARAHEKGFAAYLTKPVQPRMLLRCLEVVLGGGEDAVTGPVTRRSVAAGAGPRVLLGESHRVYQKLVAGMIQRAGAMVDLVDRAEQAATAVERHHYDLILLEAELPGIPLAELVSTLRTLDGDGRRTPLMVMASGLDHTERSKLQELEVEAVVSRPLERDELADLLERWTTAGVGFDTVEVGDSEDCLPVNVARLVEASGGSAPFERQLVELFCEQVSVQIDRLAELVDDEALGALHKAAATLRATCVNFGATRLAEIVAALEEIRDARAGRSVMTALRAEYASTRQFLKSRNEGEPIDG